MGTSTYTYDTLGRLVGATNTDPTGTSTYLFDGGDLLEELNPASGGDTVERPPPPAPSSTASASRAAPTSTPTPTPTSASSPNHNGTTLARHAYTPWGGHTTTGGAALDPYQNRHTFAGATGVRDDDGGLIDMRNRMYDTTLGIFISRDPIEAMTREPDRYVGGNPVGLVDPWGLCSVAGIRIGFMSRSDGGCKGSDGAREAIGAVGDGIARGSRAVGSYVYEHSAGLSQIAAGASAAAYAVCPFTGLSCGVGGFLSWTRAGLAGMSAHRTCEANGYITGACGLAGANLAMSVVGAGGPRHFTLQGRHFSQYTIDMNAARWNLRFAAGTFAASGLLNWTFGSTGADVHSGPAK